MLRKGRRLRGDHTALVYAGRDGGAGARLALVVPRRTGNAVKRNRIRRIFREEARLATRVRPLPYDLALCWKGPIEPGSGAQAHAEARRLLGKLADAFNVRQSSHCSD